MLNLTDENVNTTKKDTPPETLPSLEYNKKISDEVFAKMTKIRQGSSSVMPQILNKLAKELGVEIDYTKFSPQSLASQMGVVLEYVYEANFNKDLGSNLNYNYVRGSTLAAHINKMRVSNNIKDLTNFKQKLTQEYYFTDKYVNTVLATPKKGDVNQKLKPIHLPDSFVVIKNFTPITIKCVEMKASGQNDSSSVPENIDKLVDGTRNSAIEPWEGNDKVVLDKAILIIAASVNKVGNFMHKNKWVNEINNQLSRGNRGGIQVHCNQGAYNFISGKTITAEQYEKDFLATAAHIELKRILEAQN